MNTRLISPIAFRPGSILILLAALCAAAPQVVRLAPQVSYRAAWRSSSPKSAKIKARAVQAQALLHRLSARPSESIPHGFESLLADLLLVVEFRLQRPESALLASTGATSLLIPPPDFEAHYDRPPPVSRLALQV